MYTDNDRYHEVCAQFERLGLITDITRVIKQGKEGSVLLCHADDSLGADYCVVKIFRDNEYRNFRNDRAYLGGKVWKRRDLAHLNATKSDLWVETEFNTLTRLYEAGVPVPQPYDRVDHAVCMQHVGEGEDSAPMLKEIRLSTEEARQVYAAIVETLDSMLSLGVVHADLSAFNILYNSGRAVLIDFPQSVSPDTNPNAFALFCHDVSAVCGYFSRLGLEVDEWGTIEEIWSRYYRMTS